MSDVLKTITHKDKQIDVTWSHGNVRFTVKGCDLRSDTFDTLEKARDAIDRFFSTQSRVITNAASISKNVLDANGYPLTVVGINRTDGSLKVKNYTPTNYYGHTEKQTSFTGDVYPDRPWIRQVLAELRELHAKERALNEKICKAKARLSSGRYGKVTIDEYEGKIARVCKDIENAEAQANYLEKARERAATEKEGV